MTTIIKPSAAIRQNYNEIAALCKEKREPVFLTKNGEGELVVMDVETYDQRVKQLELREKLIEIEEQRNLGVKDFSAKEVGAELRQKLREYAECMK
ncbi:type II toxin-antitoxin system Phd/YefM family antitoxin [Anaerovorax odorimutans]|uniref:Antitoxin n=1 Tax=Anaerovorax odorimutans TaxID=109327 RepID=A0ABT1RR15_9FIRM|nr:type II toxin-antitoxin system Phd/YefM family antitoxin [Anaerovorax odorimutans]MCQ4637617.1 type II toxin-antitoxin system Phd/YefM family antitoxin [Anaerovorax odorimutans]